MTKQVNSTETVLISRLRFCRHCRLCRHYRHQADAGAVNARLRLCQPCRIRCGPAQRHAPASPRGSAPPGPHRRPVKVMCILLVRFVCIARTGHLTLLSSRRKEENNCYNDWLLIRKSQLCLFEPTTTTTTVRKVNLRRRQACAEAPKL